jgi:TATA-box binding protein (TBP) (component of TFIID and TFIIIB)
MKRFKEERGAMPLDESAKEVSQTFESSKPFKSLPISTQTVMAYANCTFNIESIFQKLPVEDIGDTPIKKINGEHGKIYQLKRAGQVRGAPTKKGNFRNQITTYIYILDKMITVKIFPTGKFHLTGCKRIEHQQQAIVQLMHYIRVADGKENHTFQMEDEKPLNVILEVVMVNVDFHLGFEVDQRKLDQILQQENNDFHSVFETPVNTSVNIKLEYPDPSVKKYPQIIFKGTIEKPHIIYTTTGECLKARTVNKRTHTFLVFSSSKVIQSGRYYDSEMEPAYCKFNDFIQNNRKNIELKLKDHSFDMKCLRGLSSTEPLLIKSRKIHQ